MVERTIAWLVRGNRRVPYRGVAPSLNAALAADPRWETVLLPLADGLTMLRRR